MTSWKDFEADQPDFARRVQRLFKRQKHMTMATLRRDGSPRISGTEVEFDAEDLVLGMTAGARKVFDLARDDRLALHSPSVDPPAEDERSWPGEAKIAGRAVEILDNDRADGSHRYRVDITEVVLTALGSSCDHLVIESWHPDRGLESRQRQ
jgi:hypothetical protein